MRSTINTVIVVGGGLSGLIAATHLQNQGIKTTVLDKGYGIGGRLASRSLKSGETVLGFFDYGMQHFIAQDKTFKSWVDSLTDKGIVTSWQGNYQETSDTSITTTKYYRGIQSNRAIAQHLAQELTVINQIQVNALCWQDSKWNIKATNGRHFQADAVIMTPPVPQTLEIFAASDLKLTEDDQSKLVQVSYDPCLSLMTVLDRPSKLPASGGIKIKKSPLEWIASNYIKGISPQGYAITLLAEPAFSEAHWDSDTKWITGHMLQAAQPFLTGEFSNAANSIHTRLHRWKYRHPKTIIGQQALRVNTPGPLILAGDAFCTKLSDDQSLNVENAFLSGRVAAKMLSI